MTLDSQLNATPHRRYNILSGEWVLVSAHRANRPWQGQVEDANSIVLPKYDPECYLCPGNTRVSGEVNPDYSGPFIFTNDHAALLPDQAVFISNQHPLLQAQSESGCCKVICFTPRHDLTLAQMSVMEISQVVELWCQEYQALGQLEHINHVQIFENKGAIMGCSNPHPHGQIWAQASIPSELQTEIKNMQAYRQQHGSNMLIDYVNLELGLDQRVVYHNAHFVTLVPYWAAWPFEVIIIPKKQIQSLNDLSVEQQTALADCLKITTVKYDNLFQTSFAYSAGIHQAPVDDIDYPEMTMHMHFYPPLLRSASIKKFMVGYEMLAESQRDITPEKAAKILKEASETHYLSE